MTPRCSCYCCQNLSLHYELIAATFRQWVGDGIQDLGKPAIEELTIEWFNPFLTKDEAESLLFWGADP